jgi:predicted transglutaminase-like cysteine proteinase
MAKFLSLMAFFAFAGVGGCATMPPPGDVAVARPYDDGIPPASQMPQSAIPGPIPAGFIGFCLRYSDQCELPDHAKDLAFLTPANWELLNRVNRATNMGVQYKDDMPHYGIADYWTIAADGSGDCEDFALTKRKALIDAGLPVAALRIAVVLTSTKERHAILTVATDRGDYVLDSMSDDVRPWTETNYQWLERQDPKKRWGWDRLYAGSFGSQPTAATRRN